jgi:hypothetical protein
VMSRTDVPEYPRSAKQDAAAWMRRLRVDAPPLLATISGFVLMKKFKQTFDPDSIQTSARILSSYENPSESSIRNPR